MSTVGTTEEATKASEQRSLLSWMKRVPGNNRTEVVNTSQVNVESDVALCHRSGLVFADTYKSSTSSPTCLSCSASLTVVKAHKRTRNGVRFQVRAFFRHPVNHENANCCNESIDHKAAKRAAVQFKDKLRYSYKCVDCSALTPIHLEGEMYEEEIAWNASFRLDVGIRSNDGAVVGAVEIYHTHAISNEKARAMTDAGLAWCEVTSKRVLDAVRTGTYSVVVLRCAYDTCAACIEKTRKAELDRLDQELDLSIKCLKEETEFRKNVIERAGNDWRKLQPYKTHCADKEKAESEWQQLVSDTMRYVSDRASQLGISDLPETDDLAHDLLSNVPVLTFGQYKGHTVDRVSEMDWKYTLWLAGWNFGRMDENGRAEKRRRHQSVEYITKEIQTVAKEVIEGRCFRCEEDIPEWDQCKWKTWCTECYRDLRGELQGW